jgi:hypothetical protein
MRGAVAEQRRRFNHLHVGAISRLTVVSQFEFEIENE